MRTQMIRMQIALPSGGENRGHLSRRTSSPLQGEEQISFATNGTHNAQEE
jgi:hypothetical protein